MKNPGKKLLAVITAAVMTVGCVQTAFAAYTMTAADTAAFNISKAKISATTYYDKKEEEKIASTNVGVAMDPAKNVAMVAHFHAQNPKRQLFMVFGLKGSVVDDEEGTTIKVVDDRITKDMKFKVSQFNKKTGEWKEGDTVARSDGKLSFKTKSNNAVAISIPDPVYNEKPKFVKITNKPAGVLEPGDTQQLGVSYSASTTLDVSWSSSNKKVATVGKKTGLVKAKKPGTTTISVKVGKKTVKCTIKVKKVLVDSITINSSVAANESGIYELPVDGWTTLTASVLPASAANKDVKWEITNKTGKKIATLKNKTGKKCILDVKDIGPQLGDLITVKATAKDGSKKKATITFRIRHN
ncbi:MAG: Ig-like domain-containing protein [Lachnospiraceae bacterium]|nr:Ig-like domain-containing protein [Lachnospiraceae bacterium]